MSKKGFTLVELLVVVSIIIILAAIGFTIFTQLTPRARDATRVADLNSLKNAIVITSHDATDSAIVFCAGSPVPCQGSSFPTDINTGNTDGTGWVKVDFDSKNVAKFNTLPLDPVNDSTHYFDYYSDGINWKIKARLESSEYSKLMQTDGGSDSDAYEVGIGLKTLP